MLNRLPRQLPLLSDLLNDIGNPEPKAIAKSLQVSERTVRMWLKQDHAPHAAMLALYWLTKWGRSEVDCEAHNAAVMSATMARARLDRINELQGQIKRLGQIAQFGSANDPADGVVGVARVTDTVDEPAFAVVQPLEKLKPTSSLKLNSTQQPCGLQPVYPALPKN